MTAASEATALGGAGPWRFPVATVVVGLLAILVPQLVGSYYVSVALTLCMWIALTQSWTILSGSG